MASATQQQSEHFWINSTVRIAVAGVKNTKAEYVNDAQMVGTLREKDGTPVDNVGEITFSYTPGSNGNYDAFFLVPATLLENRIYDVHVVATADNRQFAFRIRRTAKTYPG